MVGPRKQDFWPKIRALKRNYYILRIRGVPVCQKWGMILENKVTQKIKRYTYSPIYKRYFGQKSCFLGPTIFEIPLPK